jgi:iron complex transport system substrate-binding protein
MKKHSNLFILLLILAVFGGIGLGAQERIVIGGRSSMMLADSVYLFPDAEKKIVAYARGDQGLGNFITAIDPNFKNSVWFDRNAGAEVYASFKPDLVILKSSMMSQL